MVSLKKKESTSCNRELQVAIPILSIGIPLPLNLISVLDISGMIRIAGETIFEGCPIHTNRLQWNSTQSTGIPLVKCISLRRLKISLLVSAECECILLVHWYDWYRWNNTYSIGILLVRCISLRGLGIFLLASG